MKPLLTAFLILLSLVGISVIPNSFNKNISVSTVDTLPPYNTNYQSLGSQNVMVQVRGGIKGDSTMIMPLYADTAAANLKRTVWYGGAMIFTADNNFWIRNMAATAWLKVIGGGSGGGGAVDSVTSTKLACLDIQKYWSGGTGIAYDTIALYDGILKPGLVTQTGVLTFDVTQYIYRLACELTKTPLDTTVSVSTADDSLLRIDLIGGNGLGQVQVIEGTPSESATPPTYDINQFIPFTQVFISSDTTYLIPIAPNLDGRYVKIAVPDTITAQKTVRDTLILGPYPLASDNLIIKAGTPINQFAYAIDTVALQQVRANFWQYVIGTSGTTVPKYSMLFKSPYATPLSLNANGEASFGNGLVMELGGKIHGNAITYLGNSATLKHNITGATSALNANGVVLQVDNSTASNNGALSRSLSVRGNGYRRVLEGYTQGVVANNDNPSSKAVIDFNGQDNVPNSLRGEGKGVIFPRMTTAQRDGIPKRVATVTLTDGGTTMTTAPIVSVVTTGIRPVIIPTLVGGVVTALTLIDGGSNITANGNLVFDTTGTFATTIPIGTYTFTTDTIPNALMVFNTDSGCYQSYYKTANAWVNMREGSGGGGGITQGQLDDSTAAIRAALAAGTTVNPKFNPYASNNIFLKELVGVFKPTASAVANSAITWAFLDTTSNGVHQYVGFDSVAGVGNLIRLYYPPVKFVVSMVVTPDETLANAGVICGPSVGTANADVSAYRLTMNAGKLTGNGSTTWTASGVQLSVNSYSSGNGLTSITPTMIGGTILGASNEIEGTQISYVGTNNYHIQRKYSGLGGLIGFYLVENLTNNIVTGNLSTTDVVSILFARPITAAIPAQTVNSVLYPSDIYGAAANYWVKATFELWFRAYPTSTTGSIQTMWQSYKIGSNYATNYRITRAPLSSPGTETTIFNGYGFSYTDTGATSGTQYIYRMYATVSAVEALVTNEKCIAP